MLNVERSLSSVSSLCDDYQMGKFTNKKLVVKKKNWVASIGKQAGGMYSVNLQQANVKALFTLDFTIDMLGASHSNPANSD